MSVTAAPPKQRESSVRKRLAVHGLGHRFPGADWLFRVLDFEVLPGEIVAISGPSGSGKSTLLSLVAGWVVPSEGNIVRDNVERVGWVFQNPHGVPERTALDHVVLPILAKGINRDEAEVAAQVALERFALSGVAERPFAALSGGEAQRLMLARAVCSQPDLLLIDEPTAQLDRTTSAIVNSVIAQVAQESTIVLVATHDAMTKEACTRIIDLDIVAPRHVNPGEPT